MTSIVYKISTATMWRDAVQTGTFRGARIDLRDGYIHLSTAAQVIKTAERHFAGATDLLLVAVDRMALGDILKWEPSRGGDLFPHLYGQLPVSAVIRVDPLPLGPDGRHVFPELAA